MTIKEQLESLFDRVNDRPNDIASEFERLGMHDHENIRAFGAEWGEVIGVMILSEGRLLGPDDLGATMVGGILLGLMLAESGFLTAGGSGEAA